MVNPREMCLDQGTKRGRKKDLKGKRRDGDPCPYSHRHVYKRQFGVMSMSQILYPHKPNIHMFYSIQRSTNSKGLGNSVNAASRHLGARWIQILLTAFNVRTAVARI
jgi:hypothetical protein